MFGDDQWPPELRPKKNQSNFIHKTAIVGVNVVIGKGNYIGPYCLITGGTIIGNRTDPEGLD